MHTREEEARCIACGCTDLRACAGGCYWLDVNRDDGTGVCSKCPKSLTQWRNQQADDALAATARHNEEQGAGDGGQPSLLQIGPTDI